MMKFIQLSKDELLNVECIESLHSHYLDGTVIIGKSGMRYITNRSLEEVLDLLEKIENEN